MSFNYRRSQATALRLIKNFGVEEKLVRESSDYEPIEAELSNKVYSTSDATVVKLPQGFGSNIFDKKFLAQYQKQDTLFFYIADKGLVFAPEGGDMLVFSSELYDVMATTPLNPAGINVLYAAVAKLSPRTEPELTNYALTKDDNALLFGDNNPVILG